MNDTLALFFEPEPECPADTPPARPAREHRAQILRLRTAAERRAAIEAIADARTRAAVRFYIADHFARLHHRALPDLAAIEAEEGLTPWRTTPCRLQLPMPLPPE